MNWIESSIEGSKLFICSGCTCTCRDAISDQEKEALGLLPDSFYCRRDFSGCLAKASPSKSVEAMDSVNSNAAREGSDGSNCDRVFILFDIFHCSNCDDELQEHRIVYGEIIENIDQIREELNGMRQRLKKLLLRNCSTEFPPMESITSNVSHTSSGVIDDCVRGSAIKDTEIKNKEELITPNVSYEWSGVIDKRVHSSVPKDIEIKHQEDDIRKQRSRSEDDKAKEAADHKKELLTSKISYESSREINKGVHGLVLKDTEMKKKEDTIVANVSYESYEEINNHVHGSDFNVTEIKNQEDDIRKQRSMGEDKEKEAVNNKKESITSNISYEWSGVLENCVHDSVLNDTGIRHKESQVIDNRVHSSILRDTKTKHKEDSITSNVSYESSWEIENRVPSSFLNDTEIKNKEESITSSISYEWPGVIDNRVQCSFIKDTKTKQKEDDIRKQRSRSEDKAKKAADHKKELMTSKVSNESSREIDKGVHGLVLKDTEMKRKEDTIGSNVPYESYEGINNRVHGSVFNATEIKNQEDDIRKQRSMVEDKEKEIVDNKTESITSNISYEWSGVFENRVHDSILNDTGIRHKEELMTSKVSYESSPEIDKGVHGLVLKDTEMKKKEDDIQKQRSMGEDKEKEIVDHKKESVMSNISYERSGVFENRVHDSVLNDTGIRHKEESINSNVSYESSWEIDNRVPGSFFNDTEIKKKEDDIRKQKSSRDGKTNETDYHKKESITSNVSYEWSRVIDNRVHGSVSKDTKTIHKEDDIRKQNLRNEDKAKEAVDHKKVLMTSKVSYESSREIDKGIHGLVLKDIELKQKEDGIRKQRSISEYKGKGTVDRKKESIISDVSYESPRVAYNPEDSQIKFEEDDIQNQRSRSEDKAKETFDHKKESITSTVSNESPKLIDNRVHGSVPKHTVESITSNVPRVSSGVIDYHVHGSFLNDTESKNKEDVIGKQKSRSGDKEKETAHPQKTSTFKQNTRPPGRQRLQRKEDIWPGSGEIRYGGDGSVMETEIKTDDKTRPRRQRLERGENICTGSDVSGDGLSGSVLKDAEIKLKDDDDIPNPWSNSNLKAKETIDDNKFQDYVPNPVSMSEDASEETVDDNKVTEDSSIPSNDSKSEGFEVIGEGVPEIKPKDMSSHSQKPRPRRQKLQRKGEVWPGYEVIGDGVHGSILMEIEIKQASSYNQKTRQRRQRLQRKV